MVVQQIAFGHFQTIPPDRGLFQLRIDVTGVVVFAMAAQAQQVGDDHLRSAARSRLADCVAHHFEAGGQVGAIRSVPANPVTGGLVQERAAGKLSLGGSGIGVVVIGHDQHQRQFLDGGLVDGFVEGAGGSGRRRQYRWPRPFR